ncbi:MAG: MFS transporter [Deltaproteobacteria bacterium]|nr:MFS transporter [Deltaproteobacteria bacterium]MBW1950555.1 MFS transporter [Deltaproteobacteria bacterium]MBW2007550.1 MFS transporter [Deltaproteobacteria bacterium]MBW2346814.1 MFS transporter [Deltaproteobacteria bacterium]
MSRRWRIFLITSSLFFLSQFYRASNAVISPQLIRDLSLDTGGLGTLSAAFFYAFALTQVPLSIFLDRVGARRIMTGLSLMGVLGAVIFAWADNLAVGVAGRVLMGVGMSCNLMGTFKLLTVWFGPASFATLSGIVFSIGTAGNMAATTPLVLLVENLGWRITFCIIAGVNLVIALALYAIVSDHPEGGAGAGGGGSHGRTVQGLAALRVLFKTRDYWIISVGTCVRYGILAAFQVLWAGPYLMETMGLSPLAAGNMILLLNLGLITGGPLWGCISDRVLKTRKWIVILCLGLAALLTFVMGLLRQGAGVWTLGPLFLGFGLLGASGGLMYTHIKELVPLEMAGTAMTGINFFTMMGPAVFLQGWGYFMQALHPEASRGIEAFQASLFACAAFLGGVSVLYLFTREREADIR